MSVSKIKIITTPSDLLTSQQLVSVPSLFVDYIYFRKPQSRADTSEGSFRANAAYVEQADFPRLLDVGTTEFVRKKHNTQYAIVELEARRGDGEISDTEYDLAIAAHEVNVRKMMMVQDAGRMLRPGSSGELQTARASFDEHNTNLYGEIDRQEFSGVMDSEQTRFSAYNPKTAQGRDIKEHLDVYYGSREFDETERPLMDEALIAAMHKVITARFAAALDVVPDTQDTKFDASQCKDIVQSALNASGLGSKDWVCVLEDDVQYPSTNAEKRTVKLPIDTTRTADELRRLIIHELCNHARRGQNGIESGVYALQAGTADYADVEEGNGVIYECAVAGNLDNPSYHRTRDRYIVAGLALGEDGGVSRDKRETYELAWRIIAVRFTQNGTDETEAVESAQNLAYAHVHNAFRGTTGVGKGVIYRKLKVYWEGLRKNADYYQKNRSNLRKAIDTASIGKYNHTDADERAKVQTILKQKAV